LRAGAEQLGVVLNDGQVEQLSAYAELVVKWNKAVKLISRKDIGRLASRHLLDSLASQPLLRGDNILDLGSGAGLPGIVLAIASPQLAFTLIDRSERRARFLQHVVRELDLSNVAVETGEIGRAPMPDPLFDCILARGVATGPVVWDMVHLRLAPTGCVLVYESTQSGMENVELPQIDGVRISRHECDIPGLEQSHSILCMEYA